MFYFSRMHLEGISESIRTQSDKSNILIIYFTHLFPLRRSEVKHDRHNMAKATVGAAGIEYIQGALKRPKKQDGHKHGNYLVMTHRTAATTNPNCQRIYSFAADRYNRSTPLSAREAQIRTRFTAVTRAVAARAKDLMNMTTDQANFLAQKDQPGGKKTMKSYLWSICAAAYDAEHNG